MPKHYPRSNRVEELAREVLSEAVQELKDPRVGFVTVTGVKLSRDLRIASVYVSSMGDDEQRERSIAALKHARPHLRSVMARQVRLRRLPELEIVEDRTVQTSARLEELLREAGVGPTDGAAREDDEGTREGTEGEPSTS